MKIAAGSIDLSKIDKKRIERFDKDGNPFKNGAMYLPVTIVINDQPDKYGNIITIKEGRTLDERGKGVKDTYLGNFKIIWENDKKEVKEEPKKTAPLNDLDLPF